MPQIKSKRDDILTSAEVELMIGKAWRRSTKALIAFLYVFGTRITEALNLKHEDIEVNEEFVIVRIRISKRGSKSGVPFVHTLKASIEAPFMYHFTSYAKRKEKGKVFTMHRATAWRRIKATNETVWPHLFRHTRLTRLAEAGASAAQLMVWAGWSSIKPATVYVHRTERIIDDLARKIK